MKNIKLLLATTAMLSMGVIVAKATTPTKPTAELGASVVIMHPMIIDSTAGSIDFGYIMANTRTAENPAVVKVNPDGSLDGTATNAIVVTPTATTPIKITSNNFALFINDDQKTDSQSVINEGQGGTHNYTQRDIDLATDMVASINGLTSENGYGSNFLMDYSLSENSIKLYDSRAEDDLCGEVTELTPRWKYTTANGGTLELYFGGTFTMNKDYVDNADTTGCYGNILVTFIGKDIF